MTDVVSNDAEIDAEINELIPSVEEVLSDTSTVPLLAEAPVANILYTEIGQKHNEGLAGLLELYPHGVSSKNLEEQTFNNYFRHHNYGEVPPAILEALKKNITLENYSKGFPDIVAQFQNKGTRKYLSRFLSEIKKGRFASINDFSRYIGTVQNRLNRTRILKEQDKSSVLSMLSIYNSSANFWNKKTGENEICFFGWSWKSWLIMAGCDAIGGLIGGLIGSTIPGYGTAGGAIVGAIAGSALAGSVIKIVDESEYNPQIPQCEIY